MGKIKIWSVMLGIGAFIGLAASVWGVSSHWHSYTSAEVIHEVAQKQEISKAIKIAEFAVEKSQLAIDQQRVKWLEERIFGMEQEYGCEETRITTSCSSRIWRTYQKYLKEYNFLFEKIAEQTTSE